MSITPSKSSSSYTFTSCNFTDIIASTYGGAVYITEALNSTVLTFDSCFFSEITAEYGGVVYVSFSVSSSTLSSYYSVFPVLTMTSCNSTNIFATSGGLIYTENLNISISSHRSVSNDPTNSTINSSVATFLENLSALGEYIFVTSSFLTADSLYITGHSIDTSGYTDNSNPLFL